MVEPCSNCGNRPATLKWVGDTTALAISHGWSENWCECCALEAQLEHAKAMAAKIPELEVALAKLAKEPVAVWDNGDDIHAFQTVTDGLESSGSC